MKSLILLAIVAILFSGCGYIDREMAKVTGAPSDVCHDGVVYSQFTSGVSVKLHQDGSIVTCKE